MIIYYVRNTFGNDFWGGGPRGVGSKIIRNRSYGLELVQKVVATALDRDFRAKIDDFGCMLYSLFCFGGI